MERKIGEIFEIDGEWYQCLKGLSCKECDFSANSATCDIPGELLCTRKGRSDDTSVVFKRLEKVGGPFIGKVHIQLQRYKIYAEPIIDPAENVGYVDEGNTIAIEIVQNKEDMETTISNDVTTRNDATEHSNIENNGKNLKPFDLEAAKSGKPVCTRDGRKARIICFDQKDIAPIVGLVTGLDGKESIYAFYKDGRVSSQEERVDDLMMLPEKKEGWVNVYRDEESKRVYCGEFIFSEREKAEKHYECNDTKVATASIGWEE